MKFEQKTYFKLCTRSNNKLLSCFIKGRFQLEYSLNKLTRPIPGSLGILVFDTIYNLKYFQRTYFVHVTGFSILECLVQGPVVPVSRLIHLAQDIYLTTVTHGVKRMNRARRVRLLTNWGVTSPAPLGTLSVGSVKPIRQINTWVKWSREI